MNPCQPQITPTALAPSFRAIFPFKEPPIDAGIAFHYPSHLIPTISPQLARPRLPKGGAELAVGIIGIPDASPPPAGRALGSSPDPQRVWDRQPNAMWHLQRPPASQSSRGAGEDAAGFPPPRGEQQGKGSASTTQPPGVLGLGLVLLSPGWHRVLLHAPRAASGPQSQDAGVE